MWSADKWEQYRLIDSADGEKLEYWGDYLLRRPDPQAVWSLKSDKKLGIRLTLGITVQNRAAESGST